MDRDENSAVNILKRYVTGLTFFVAWYFAGLPPHTEMYPCGVLQDEQREVGVTVMPHVLEVQQLTLW